MRFPTNISLPKYKAHQTKIERNRKYKSPVKCDLSIGDYSRVGFTKGLTSKICLKSKMKVLNVKNFVIKLRQNLCLDKMGFTKVYFIKFCLNFKTTAGQT